MRKLTFIFCWLMLAFVQQSWAAAVETVSHYQLKNGLNIFVKVDKRAPVVVSQVWYKVGSSYEPNGITGISHALEHMMFEGSKNYPGDEFSSIIAANGGEENATTDYDYTYFFQTLSADKLAISFQLEADRMQNLILSPTAFNKEIKVVREERRMRIDTNPQGITFERFMAAAYLSNPYHHPVAGWMSDLNHMTVNDVRNWYHQWYAPNNAIIVVVGDVNPNNVYQLAEKYFGSIPSHSLPIVKPHPEVLQLGERIVKVNVPAKLPMIFMGYNVPSIKTAKIKWEPYALDLTADILDSGASSRFPSQLIRGSEVASSAQAGYNPFARLSTEFILVGTPAINHTIPELQKALLAQIKKLKTIPVTLAELNRVKTQLLSQKTFANDSIEYQATQIGGLEAVGLSWHIDENYIEEVNKITPAQIQAVAKKYFGSNRLTIAYLNPKKINTTTTVQPMQSSSPVGETHVH